MILLSALLASLTGLVAGERPAERAQVEFSAVAAIVETGEAEAPRQLRPAGITVDLTALMVVVILAIAPASQRSARTRLSLKQSWLI